MRRLALDLLTKDTDDLTDMEVINRTTDEGWYLDLCLEQLHRLPSEVDPVLLCREYTALQARALVKRAQQILSRRFQGHA